MVSLPDTRTARGRSLDRVGLLAEAGRPSRSARDTIGDIGPEP
jgi:hypothetical protein